MEQNRFEDIVRAKLRESEAEVPAHLWAGIADALPRRPKTVQMKTVYRYAAACAALLFLAGSGLYFLRNDRTTGKEPVLQELTGHDMSRQLLSGNRTELNERDCFDRRPENREGQQGRTDHDMSRYNLSGVSGAQPVSAGSLAENRTDLQEQPEREMSRHNPDETRTDREETPGGKRETATPAPATDKEYKQQLKAFEAAGQRLTADGSFTRKTAKRRGFTVGLMASNALPDNKNTENQPLTRSAMLLNDNLQLYQAEEPLKFMHKTPLSFGLTVEKRLPRNWGLESGLVYTLLRSDYQTPSHSRQGKQEFHYLGIPLNAIYRFATVSRVSFYAAAGGEADFNISGRRIEDVHSSNKEVKQTEDIRDRRVQWSVHAKAGAACTLFKTTELYAEPGVSYYIDSGNLPNLWKDHPVNFTVQLGWRTLF